MTEGRGASRATGDRGVSTTVGYVLTLAVTTVLVSGLLLAGGGLVEDQRERSARTELEVVGQRLAQGLETADRLNRTTGANGNVYVEVPLPERVAGSAYTISVSRMGSTAYDIECTVPDVGVSVVVRVTSRTPVATSTTAGGSTAIAWNGSARSLEVAND